MARQVLQSLKDAELQETEFMAFKEDTLEFKQSSPESFFFLTAD